MLAGLCEIGGGYLVWLAIKEGKSVWYAIVGSLILILYGFVATLQPREFREGLCHLWRILHCAFSALGI